MIRVAYDTFNVTGVIINPTPGVGGSDKPYARYSTSEMAKDVIDLLEHVGWTNPNQLHVIGVSMGGMYVFPNW